jgi:hypothetical protein
MDVLRYTLAGAALALLVAMAGVTWLFTHQGYPNVVYYERLSLSFGTQSQYRQPAELWVDPARNVALRATGGDAGRTSYYTEPVGRTIVADPSGTYPGDPYTDDEWQAFTADNAVLRRGGFLGLAEARLAHAQGTIRRVSLSGHEALQFETTLHAGSVDHLVIWLDAHTHAPLQLQVSSSGYTLTQTVLQTRRLAAGSLPSGFFEPPRRRDTLWDSTLSWVRDHLVPGR